MATNREWLYSLDVADLAEWFDAEHVDNDDELKKMVDGQREVIRRYQDSDCGKLIAERDELQAKVNELQIQLEAMCDLANDYRFERDELEKQLDTMRDVARDFRAERDAWHERFDKANREKCDLQSRDTNQRHNNLLNRLREKGVCVRWDDSRSDYTVLLANCDEARELQERVDTLTRYIHDIKQIARKV